jgi:NAD(P) transhydrogenase
MCCNPSQKLLCAAGRLANVKGLQLENAGLAVNDKDFISIDENLRTNVANIYVTVDFIGPPPWHQHRWSKEVAPRVMH